MNRKNDLSASVGAVMLGAALAFFYFALVVRVPTESELEKIVFDPLEFAKYPETKKTLWRNFRNMQRRVFVNTRDFLRWSGHWFKGE